MAATEVHDQLGVVGAHLGDEVGERPAALPRVAGRFYAAFVYSAAAERGCRST